mgnify:CR=1 FL=1
MIDQIQTIERAIDVLEPWKSPANLLPLDQLTMDKWLGADWMPPGARSLVSVAVNAVISVEPPQISPFYFFWYSACNDGFLQECNDEEGGPQQYYLKCGVDALVQKVAAPILDKITFNSPVESITRGADLVTVTTTSGDVWEAKQVVVAMSPHTAGKLSYSPALPDGYGQDDDGGCACSHAPGPSPGPWLLALLALAGRRRRARTSCPRGQV